DRGVELLRLPERRGKTAAENAARAHLRGTIIVNTDASVRIALQALKPLVAAFADPTVGVASGRDVSVARVGAEANAGESTYVGYEMWVRDLETRVSGIVGASGCLYAIRAELHRQLVPEDLSRDFGAALLGAVAALAALAAGEGWGWSRGALAGLVAVAVVGAAGWWWPEGERPPGLLALAAYLFAGNVAALHAWLLALLRARTAVWEPT